MTNQPIILFDGYCNFCSKSVDFILKYDRKKYFIFAASESNTGKTLLEKFNLKEIDSVVLITNGKAYRYSTAVLKISAHLNFPFNLFAFFLIIPVFLRDIVYQWIAANRYKWFGKRISCRLPQPEDKGRFLT